VLNAGGTLKNLNERYQSSFVGSLARRVQNLDVPSEASLLKEIYKSDPERVIQIFESQPWLHSNRLALSEYVKALVKVDRLDDSTLLKTLRRGTDIHKHLIYFTAMKHYICCFCWAILVFLN
jgi:ATP-dependent metalloprotease